MTSIGTQRKLLCAILITLVALAAHNYLPRKTQQIWPLAHSSTYFFAGTLPDGSTAAKWIDERIHQWRCTFPEQQTSYFPCGLNIKLGASNTSGVDFSQYRHLRLRLDYTGSAHTVQIALRNYNSQYTALNDPNSTKFMAVNLRTQELNHDLLIDLQKFTVAHWWVVQYEVPLAHMQSEMNNITSLSVDFPSAETHIVGNQDMALTEVELIGEWVSKENWYLGILLLWLGGILSWVLIEFIRIKRRNSEVLAANSELFTSNQHLKSETDRFRHLSYVDPLTQTYNRAGTDNIVNRLIENAKGKLLADGLPVFSIILIDIDFFKKINDTYGHDVGDKVLISVAQTLAQHVRNEDYICRWGGEEFLIIQPNLQEKAALGTAERICKIIEGSSIEPSLELKVTASFGISELRDGEPFSYCLKRADQALYKAKSLGRNCCVLAQ